MNEKKDESHYGRSLYRSTADDAGVCFCLNGRTML